jgi:predicted GNAT family acetyltransferase
VELSIVTDAARLPPEVDLFLAQQLDRNLAATVLAGIRRGRYGTALVGWVPGTSGSVHAVLLRTPPHPLLSTELESGEAEPLLEAWLREDPRPPGVSAPAATARALCAAWEGATGGAASLRMGQHMHVLARVDGPPRPAAGTLRAAGEQDRGLLVEWELEFIGEAGVTGAAEAERTIAARLAAGSQFLWEDGGPVSTVANSPIVGGTARIGPVYTPPEQRRRGYASSAVAELARHLLERGAQRCMLFTDQANPTSQRIYASVGFRPAGAWEWHEFGEGQAASPGG